MTGVMRKMDLKTKRGKWQVFLHYREGVSFSCNGQHVTRWDCQVPKSIWRQARCFLADPDRFGEKYPTNHYGYTFGGGYFK